jgi:hypothetical protein
MLRKLIIVVLTLFHIMPAQYTIKVDEQSYTSSGNGIKILTYKNSIGTSRTFECSIDEASPVTFSIVQNQDSEVIIKRLRFTTDRGGFTLKRYKWIIGYVNRAGRDKSGLHMIEPNAWYNYHENMVGIGFTMSI